MALRLQAPLAEHHNAIHFNLPSMFGFLRREIKSEKDDFWGYRQQAYQLTEVEELWIPRQRRP